jgi:hypothetical protein
VGSGGAQHYGEAEGAFVALFQALLVSTRIALGAQHVPMHEGCAGTGNIHRQTRPRATCSGA